jgi:hypothetical protein
MAKKLVEIAGHPIVHIKWNVGFTDADVVSTVDAIVALCKREEPWVGIVNLLEVQTPTKAQNELFTAFFNDNRDLVRRTIFGFGFVMNSIATRVAINAFSLLSRPPCPLRAVSTVQDAQNWAGDLLKVRKAG